MTENPTVLFVCVHNAGRSQIAAGYLTALSGGRVEVLSAGSAPGDALNAVAVAAMAEDGIDIRDQRPKILTTDAVRASDVVVTMGCGDTCPFFPGKRYEDWVLDDPAGQPLPVVRLIRNAIRARIVSLLRELGVPDTSPRGVAIRTAGPEDAPFIAGLLAAYDLPVVGRDDVAHQLVADDDGVPVGTVALEHHGSDHDGAFLLRSLAVSLEARARGIGTSLVEAALAIVDSADAPVGLLTQTAADFFPRFGFRPTTRDALPAALSTSPELVGACPDTATAMVRPPR